MSIKDDIAQAFHETLDENNIKENDVTRTIAVLSLFVLGIISFSFIVYTSLSLTGVI